MNIFQRHPNEKERRRLVAKIEHEGLRFENLLITLATGTIVLSVTFLRDIVIEPTAKSYLIASWIALVLSVLLGLIDRLIYIFSLSSHPLLGEQGDSAQERRWDTLWKWSETMSWGQMITFFVGIVLLLVFAIFHI